jgi:hypothetical protein
MARPSLQQIACQWIVALSSISKHFSVGSHWGLPGLLSPGPIRVRRDSCQWLRGHLPVNSVLHSSADIWVVHQASLDLGEAYYLTEEPLCDLYPRHPIMSHDAESRVGLGDLLEV